MYKVKVYRKHLIQVEIDSIENLDLIRRAFNKLLVWTDPPMFEKDPDMEFAFMAYTTKQNLWHMFNLIGLPRVKNPQGEEVIPQEFQPNWVNRLYVDKKFVKKKMSRKNYLTQNLIHEVLTPEQWDALTADINARIAKYQEDNRELKRRKKANRLAKEEAIANGTWVDPKKPKRPKIKGKNGKKIEYRRARREERARLIPLYMSQGMTEEQARQKAMEYTLDPANRWSMIKKYRENYDPSEGTSYVRLEKRPGYPDLKTLNK